MFYARPDVEHNRTTTANDMVNFSHEVLSFNSFLIFACFQGAKLSFSRTMLLPVAGNDYL